MGVNISELLVRNEISLSMLKDKIIAVDAHIFLYQFLTTIRQRDGTFLLDSQGRVTSHLAGLLSRNSKLMEHGMRLAYVFDGKPPKLKMREREYRHKIKEEAEQKLKQAISAENVEEMRKYAGRTTKLTFEMLEEAKKLITAMGLPIVQAPSEGEAQAAYLVKLDHAYASASQDADSMLFGSPRLLRNLSLAGRRKKANKLAYEEVQPEIINLSDTLTSLGISQDQLIVLGILVGTDFDEGIKGVGPKNALKLVKKYNNDFDLLFREIKWDESFDYSWQEVYDLFKNMSVTDDYSLQWRQPDRERIRELLVEEHDFSDERVKATLDRLDQMQEKQIQKGLGEFFTNS